MHAARPLALVSLAALAAPAAAQLPTVLLAEDQPLPGAPGVTIGAPLGVRVNGVGGYALVVSGSDGVHRFWGSAVGEPPHVLRAEANAGPLSQTSIYAANDQWDVDSFSRFAYAAYHVTPPDETQVLANWFEDVLFQQQGWPLASDSELDWVFPAAVRGVLWDGTPLLVGKVQRIGVGQPTLIGLFAGLGQEPLYVEGDSVPGLSHPISGLSSFQFVDFSASGAQHLAVVRIDDGAGSSDSEAVVRNGVAMTVGGGLLVEGEPVAAAGALPGETWSGFGHVAARDTGYAMAVGTSAGAALLVDGAIALRLGDVVDGHAVTFVGKLDANRGGDLLYHAVLDGTHGLVLNDQVLLRAGDAVDVDGDGAGDADVLHFTYNPVRVELSERRLDGTVDVLCVARLDPGTPTYVWDDYTAVVRHTASVAPGIAVVPVTVDPASCTGAIGSAQGVRVAVLGTPALDVAEIDPATLRLSRQDGVGGQLAPVSTRPRVKDLFTAPADPFDCPAAAPDGFADLVAVFSGPDLIDGLRLRAVPEGAPVPLILTGELADGTPFGGRDVVHLALGILDPNPGLARE